MVVMNTKCAFRKYTEPTTTAGPPEPDKAPEPSDGACGTESMYPHPVEKEAEKATPEEWKKADEVMDDWCEQYDRIAMVETMAP